MGFDLRVLNKVQEGNDQEMVHSERSSHTKKT